MNPSPESTAPGHPPFDPPIDATYTLEIVAELTGVTTRQILYYQESGLIAPVAGTFDAPAFDDETVRALRRLEHLRECYGVNDSGLRLLLNLSEEVERLRRDLRHYQQLR